MTETSYRLMKLTPGQQCFGAGEWCIERTVKEIVAAAPDANAARELAYKLAKADNGSVKE